MSLAAGKKKNTRSKSLSPSSINPYNQRRCKYGHPNKKIDSSTSSLQCADCKAKIKKYGIVYGCQRCKFYMCSACFRKPSCANGHHLKATHVKRGTLCSSCQYKSKKQRLQMYQCNQCKYQMCLGCYSYETCCGNHGLKWQKITSNTHKSMNHCKKCQRIFKINKSLFMCKKCKYSLCGDCYQPSLTLKSKIHRQQKIAQKIKSDHNNANNNNNNLNSNNGTIHILPQPPPQQQPQNQGALPLNGNVNNNTINIIPLSPPNSSILNMINPDHLGGELKNDDDDVNRMYFDQNEEEDDQKKLEFSDEDEYDQDEEEEEKKMVLTDDHLAHHNNNYNYNSYSNPIGPSSHQYSQSYHSYSHSNSHQSLSAAASNAASRSKSRERQTSKKKKKKKSSKIKDGNNGSKRKKKKSKSTKTRKKNTKNINNIPNIPNIPNGPNAINGNTPSLSLSATSSVNMQFNEDKYELSSSSQQFELSGLESIAPSEMTRIPSILTDCCICMERDKEVAFLPCGHYISCEQCAKALKADTGMCAICSAKIQSIIKIYE